MDKEKFEQLVQALNEDKREHPEDYQIKIKKHIVYSAFYETFLLSVNKYDGNPDISKLKEINQFIEPVKDKLTEPDKKEIDDLIKAIKNIESELTGIGWLEYATVYIPRLPFSYFKFSGEDMRKIKEEIPEINKNGVNTRLLLDPEYHRPESTFRVDLRGISFLYWIKDNKPEDIRTHLFNKTEDLKKIGKQDPAELIILESKLQQEYIKRYDDRISEIDEIIKKIINIYNDIIDRLKEQEDSKNFFKLPISDVTQSINSLFLIDFTDKDKKTFSSKNRYLKELEANKKNISAKFKNMKNDHNITIPDKYLYSYKLLNLPAQIQTVKLFDFIRITANSQGYNTQICFKTKDYMDYIGSKNIESTFRIIKKHLDKIKSLQILFNGTKRKPAYGFSYIITQATVTHENVWITIIPDILKGISRFITILPLWTGKLDQTGYILLEHICNIANQRRTEIYQKGSFDISIKNIIDRLELDEKEMQKRYSQFIINPIDKSINEINTISDNNSVKIIGNYKKNKDDFNKGFITIELTNEFRDFFTSNIYIKECEIEN